MRLEEDNLFLNSESDLHLADKAHTSRRIVDGRLRDRRKKRYRLLKERASVIPDWLSTEQLDELAEQVRDIDTHHHRKSRRDIAYRQDRKSLKPVAMKKLVPGAIVDAWVPFEDVEDYKRRPAAVISATKFDVEVFPLTTSIGHRRLKSPIYILEHWEESGLSRPTGMLQRRVKIPRSSVMTASGHLMHEDLAKFTIWANRGRETRNRINEIAKASHLRAA